MCVCFSFIIAPQHRPFIIIHTHTRQTMTRGRARVQLPRIRYSGITSCIMTGKFRTQCALAPPVSRLPTRSRYISDSNATHHTTRVPLPSQSKFSITSTTNFLACTALHDKTPCQHLRNISLTHIGDLKKKAEKPHDNKETRVVPPYPISAGSEGEKSSRRCCSTTLEDDTAARAGGECVSRDNARRRRRSCFMYTHPLSLTTSSIV